MKKSISLIFRIVLILSLLLSATGFSVIAVKSIKLDSNVISLNIGQVKSLKVTLIPANTTQKTLKYFTANKNVAIVDAKGKITAVGVGKTTITVATLANNLNAKCVVNVTKPVQEKVITLTFKNYGDNSLTSSWDEESTYEMSQRAFKELNIKQVKLPGGSNNLQEFAKDAAANMLPDVGLWYLSYNYPANNQAFFKAVKQGVIANVRPSIEKYAPTINKLVFQLDKNGYEYSEDQRLALFNEAYEGGYYAVPSWNFTLNETATWKSGYGFYIRGDLPGNVKPGPRSLGTAEQFTDMLRSIKAEQPKDINGKDAWPLGFQTWNQILSAVTNPFDFGGLSGVGIVNGKVVGKWQTDWPWKQVKFVRTLIKEKLLDPEVFYQTGAIYQEKAAKGKYVVVGAYYAGAYTDKGHIWGWGFDSMEAPSGNKEWKYQDLGRMVNFKGETQVTWNKSTINNQVFFFGNTSKAARAIKLAEWANKSPERRVETLYGSRGIRWDYNADNNVVIKDEYWDKNTNDFAYETVNGKSVIKGAKISAGGCLNGMNNIISPNLPGWDRNSYLDFMKPLAAKLRVERNDAGMKMLNSGGLKWKTEMRPEIGFMLNEYAKKEVVGLVLNDQQSSDILSRAYLAGSDEEAKALLDGYLKTLNNNGYEEYLKYLQDLYNKNPKGFSDYSSNIN